ncbi:MAG: helix-turn-helix domain-containing protein, partial [Halieaceae bacterium]
EPYELHFRESYSQVVLAVPQTMLEEYVTQPQRHLGVRMRAADGANGLFSQFVANIGARLENMDGVLAQRLEANVIDLLCTTLGYAADTQKHDALSSGLKDEYLSRIKAYIRNHLAEDSLTPAVLAARHDISTRYLHMLFADSGESVSRFIQRLRLEACESAFREPAFDSYSVSEIAFRFGFNDASHFSRVFKQQYGETPARFRKQWLTH